MRCFRSREQDTITSVSSTLTVQPAQYQAPGVTPAPVVQSVRFVEEDVEPERGRLLPKGGETSANVAARAPDPGEPRSGSQQPHSQETPQRVRVSGSGRVVTPTKATLTDTPAIEAQPGLLKRGDDTDDEDCCPTCLEAYTEDNPKIFTSCGHHFHMPCIYEWNERKETCPICDTPMNFSVE